MSYIRQTRPDYGFDFQRNVLKTFKNFQFSLGSGGCGVEGLGFRFEISGLRVEGRGVRGE